MTTQETPQQVRQGEISGRIRTVLAVSLLLAIVSFTLIGIQWS